MSVYHLELRQFPRVARVFNLTREEVDARFARPWINGTVIKYQISIDTGSKTMELQGTISTKAKGK